MNINRAYAKLEQKITASVGHRVDLQFEDARRINKTTANFMLSYTEDRIPTADELGTFFIKKFHGVIPMCSTAKIYKNQKLVCLIGQRITLTRPIEDIHKDTVRQVIKGAVYLDVPLQETWAVAEKEGRKILVRTVKDDIMALVAARKKSMMDTSSNNKSFASLSEIEGDLTRYLAVLGKGDRVRVLLEDKVVDATVVSTSESTIRVKHAGGTSSVSRSHILDVTSKNPADRAAKEKEAIEYYTDAYGDPSYARELVK